MTVCWNVMRPHGGVGDDRAWFHFRALIVTLLCCLIAMLQPAAAAAGDADGRRPVKITYLGNAGWQIDDGRKIILVDPYISEFQTS